MQPSIPTKEPDDEFTLGYYIVCLVDLLGQADHLDAWSELPPDGVLTEDQIAAVEKTLGNVLRFQSLFEGFFEAFAAPFIPNEEFMKLPPASQERFLRHKDHELATQQFSDTFIFYAPIQSRHGDLTARPLYQMLGAAATAMLRGLATKCPIRGAITVGTGTEIAPGRFYGPALADAHGLESKVVGSPRVVVSSKALEFCNRKSGFSKDPLIEKVSAAYHPSLTRLIATDSDGLSIVDFMGEHIYSMSGDVSGSMEAASDAYAFATSEASRFAKGSNSKLASRYKHLVNYMDSRRAIWGI